MSFGETLRAAREAKGLTCSQVAAQTRLLVQIVEEMEREDFHRIAAPIYGRGFVRLYAQCVDLDPKPLVAEFMEIYEGHRAPVVRTRNVQAAELEEAVSESAPEAPTETLPPPAPSLRDEGEAFGAEGDGLSEDVAAESSSSQSESSVGTFETSSEPPPAVRGLDLFEQAYGQKDSPSQSAAPLQQPAGRPRSRHRVDFAPEDSPFLPPVPEDAGLSVGERLSRGISSASRGIVKTVRRIPRSAWRFSVLIAAAMAFIALIGFVCVKLYQFTAPQRGRSEPPVEVAAAAPAVRPAEATAAAPVPASRTETAKPAASATASRPAVRGRLTTSGIKVPPLYID